MLYVNALEADVMDVEYADIGGLPTSHDAPSERRPCGRIS